MTAGFCGGETLGDDGIKTILYNYPRIKCLLKLVMVWLPDPAAVMLVVRIDAGFWNPGV